MNAQNPPVAAINTANGGIFVFLTIDGSNGTETYKDCFDYLSGELSTHYLLTKDEREECAEAVERLKKVFARFYGNGGSCT